MLRTFIQVASAGFALFAGILLVRGSFVLKAKDIAELSSTKWGYNTDLVKSLSQQQTDSRLGVLLLMVSFVLQTVNLCWPMRWVDYGVDKWGAILGVVVPAIFFVGALLMSNFLSDKTQKEVSVILSKEE